METGTSTSSFFARVLDFLGLDRNIIVMMAAMMLQSVGTQLWLGYTVKVLDALEAAGWMIGFYGAISAFMSAVAPYPAGLLSDRLGRGHALILASSLALVGYAIYLVAPTWLGYTVKVLDALEAAGWMIGFYGAISAFMSAVAPYPAGLLSDRLGRGHALILASSLALVGYAIYLVAPTWLVFIPGAILVRFAGSSRFMSSLALTGDRLREQRRAVSIGIQSIFSRLPRVISPPLGGMLIAYMVMRKRAGAGISEEAAQTLGLLHGFRWAVGITIVLTVIAIIIQYRYYKLPPPKQDDSPLHPFHVFRQMRVDLKRLLLADALARMGSRLYMTFTPLYVLNVLKRGYVEWGSLQSLVAITSIITYIPVAKLADRTGRHSRRPFIAATFFFFSVYPLALVLAPSATWLVPVFIISGLREVGEPARKALIMDLAAQSALGRQIGTYHMIRGILISMAPLLGGLLWGWNPMSPFILGSAISAVGFLWFVLEGILFQPNTPSEEVLTQSTPEAE